MPEPVWLPRPLVIRAALITFGGVGLFFGLVGVGAAVDAATVALAVAGAVLLATLYRLYRVAATLSRGVAAAEPVAVGLSQAELRDERRRILRALKELEFDFGMGKLSEEDYAAVSAAYKVRAIEVMRALGDSKEALHPEVAALLSGVSAAPAGAESGAGDPTSRGETGAGDPTSRGKAGATDPKKPLDPGAEDPNSATAAGSRRCSACGTANDSDARFCKACGVALEAA